MTSESLLDTMYKGIIRFIFGRGIKKEAKTNVLSERYKNEIWKRNNYNLKKLIDNGNK